MSGTNISVMMLYFSFMMLYLLGFWFFLWLGRSRGAGVCWEVHCTSARAVHAPRWLDQFSARSRGMVLIISSVSLLSSFGLFKPFSKYFLWFFDLCKSSFLVLVLVTVTHRKAFAFSVLKKKQVSISWLFFLSVDVVAFVSE